MHGQRADSHVELAIYAKKKKDEGTANYYDILRTLKERLRELPELMPAQRPKPELYKDIDAMENSIRKTTF
jgi:hypothetical protein